MILAGFKGVNVTESAGRSRGRFGPKGGSASVNPFRARTHRSAPVPRQPTNSGLIGDS